MGIDGIGKKPPVGGAGQTEGLGGVGPAQKTGATFEVPDAAPVQGATSAHGAGAASSIDAASPLARLRAGEIDVSTYVDLKVDEATAHLGAMPPSDLADIKSLLREKLVSDPGLADLVQHSTGQTPAIPED